MKKIIIFLLISLISIIAFTGCGSSEASIIDFTASGIIGEPEIDAAAGTIILNVEPMDLSVSNFTVTVSEFAEVTAFPSSIVDGEPATYTVTSEDGTAVDWSVTVNVQYGVAFDFAGEHFFLSRGHDDSGSPATAEEVGNGVPGIDIDGSSSYAYVFDVVYDLNNAPSEFDRFFMGLSITAVGTDSEAFIDFKDESADNTTFFDSVVIVSEYGDAVGKDFRAAFSGTEQPPQARAEGDSEITNGYAKLLIVESLAF